MGPGLLRASYNTKVNGNGTVNLEITDKVAIASDASIDFDTFVPGATKIQVSNGGSWADCVDESNDAIAAKVPADNKFYIHPVALTFAKIRIVTTNIIPAGTIIFICYRG